MYLRRKEIFIMIAVMDIIVLDVYPSLFHPSHPSPSPTLPSFLCPSFFLSMVYLHMYLYTRLTHYVYIHILYNICIHQRGGYDKKKKYDAKYIYVYVRVPFPTKKAYN